MPMRIGDALAGAICVLVALTAGIIASSFPAIPGQQYGAATFPVLIAAGLGICGALLLGRAVFRPAFAATEEQAGETEWSAARLLRGAFVIALVLLYIFAAQKIGFVPIMGALLLGSLLAFGTRLVPAIAVTIIATVVVLVVFYKFLRVPLPWGIVPPFV
jgi:putative tricarboxylic transport membrane protein